VLVLDVTSEEADKLLATFDTVAQLAGADAEAVASLIAGLEIHHDAVRKLVSDLSVASCPLSVAETRQLAPSDESRASMDNGPRTTDKQIPKLFQIVVECDGESSQRALYERLTSEGYDCRVLTL
jgi:hypothetical protein